MKKNKIPEIKSSPAFKLKDRADRQFVFIHLKKEFGFVPEMILIEKVVGHTNTFFVRGIRDVKAFQEYLDEGEDSIKIMTAKK